MSQGARCGVSERRTWASAMLALFVVGTLAACATLPENVLHYGQDTNPVELVETPFFPQERYQCGPAALMAVLTQSGVETTLDSLIERVYLPGRQGSLQTELVAAIRASGRIPYRIDASLSAIVGELRAGRPVLVLQNLGVSWMPRWHYAVVVGVDPGTDTVMLRSGTERRRVTRTKTFIRTWKRGEYWALVAVRPGELPANPNADRYFRAIAELESAQRLAEARSGWRAALDQWPDAPIAIFGMANVEFALDNLGTAENLYRQLLEKKPNDVSARNNLAHVLSGQAKNSEAIAQILLALEIVQDDPAMRMELEDSLAEIRRNALPRND
jgi:hypothetical protein